MARVGGMTLPAAISLASGVSASPSGVRTAIGRPCSVTSRRSPRSTRRRYLLRFCRNSRTPYLPFVHVAQCSTIG